MGSITVEGGVENLIKETVKDFTGVPAADIAVIYDALETAEPVIRKKLLDPGDREFRTGFLHELFTADKFAFRKYCVDSENGGYAEAYLGSILNIYEGYKKNTPEGMDINELAEETAELVTHGINGFRESE